MQMNQFIWILNPPQGPIDRVHVSSQSRSTKIYTSLEPLPLPDISAPSPISTLDSIVSRGLPFNREQIPSGLPIQDQVLSYGPLFIASYLSIFILFSLLSTHTLLTQIDIFPFIPL